MKELLMIPGMMMFLTTCAVTLGVVAIAFFVIFRDKITSVLVSRTSIEVRTNDVAVWCGFTDEIKIIDSTTQNSIARATTDLEIIDPESYNMSDSALLINYAANQPLLCATYANDYTRKISADKGNAYLADKTNDVAKALKPFKNKFSCLDYDRFEAHVCQWFKKIVIPQVLKACLEKIEMYKRLIEDKKINRSLKEIFEDRLQRNIKYVERINAFDGREDIEKKSSIFKKEKKS